MISVGELVAIARLVGIDLNTARIDILKDDEHLGIALYTKTYMITIESLTYLEATVSWYRDKVSGYGVWELVDEADLDQLVFAMEQNNTYKTMDWTL